MFAAILGNKFLSNKEGEYIAKVSYQKGPVQYICECEKGDPERKNSFGDSFTSVDGNPFFKGVKLFHSTKEAVDYCSQVFAIQEGPAPYRLTIDKRPKEIYTIRVSRGSGWELLAGARGGKAVLTTDAFRCVVYLRKAEAQKKVDKLNAKRWKGVFKPFEVIALTPEDLKD